MGNGGGNGGGAAGEVTGLGIPAGLTGGEVGEGTGLGHAGGTGGAGDMGAGGYGGGAVMGAPVAAGDEGSGGWYGGLTSTQKGMAQFTGKAMASGMIPAAILGIVGLALTGAGTGDVSGMGGGPGADPAKMQAHRDFTGATGMTSPEVKKEQPPAAKAAPERTRRATTKTLFTSPLGIPGEPPVKRKTLMAKNLREDLG